MEKIAGFKRLAGIKFDGSNKKYYYALFDDDIQKGDLVVVTGVAKDRILTVEDTIDVENENVSKYIPSDLKIEEVICKIDTLKYDKRVQQRERMNILRKKMDAEIMKMQEINRYETYAENNPVLAELLIEYKRITNEE